MNYFEGDILLTQQQRDYIESSQKGIQNDIQARALIKDTRKLWTNGVIPYVIVDDISE